MTEDDFHGVGFREPEADPMAVVGEERITLPVTAGQYAQLEKQQVMPGRVMVTHVVSIGPFYLNDVWVVVGTYRDTLGRPDSHRVTLGRVRD